MKLALFCICALFIASSPAHGGGNYRVAQGEVFLLPEPAVTPESRVTTSAPFPAALVCSGDACRILVAVDVAKPPGTYRERLVITGGNGRREEEFVVEVTRRVFPVQALTLPRRYVTPNRKLQARINRENRLIRAAYARPGDWPLEGSFAWPLTGEVSGEFGTRRVLNGKPAGRHMGVDLRAGLREPVHAVGGGRVALTGDFHLSGKSVFIDHGDGVFSMYFHLSRIDVQQGEMVERGTIVGLVGSTGRSVGPHLHFGMRLREAHINPAGLIQTLQEYGNGAEGNRQQVSGGADRVR